MAKETCREIVFLNLILFSGHHSKSPDLRISPLTYSSTKTVWACFRRTPADCLSVKSAERRWLFGTEITKFAETQWGTGPRRWSIGSIPLTGINLMKSRVTATLRVSSVTIERRSKATCTGIIFDANHVESDSGLNPVQSCRANIVATGDFPLRSIVPSVST